MTEGEIIKVTLPKRISEVVKNTVEMGLFSSKSDLAKTAIIKYLDDIHLLDQLKSAIETHPVDK